jgi:MFS transporter, DHA2 family, lincomycin resistance protein
VISVILSALAFGGIVYGLSSLGETSEAPLFPSWLPLAVGAVAMVVFIVRQLSLQKHDKALLDLRTFKSTNYTFSLITMAAAMMALFGMIILLPLYLVNVLKVEVLNVGLLLLPGSLMMGLLGPVVGRLYDKYGTTRLLVPGTVLVSLVMWALTMVDANTSVWAILAGHITMCLGLALTFTPLFTASLSSVPMQLYSHGSAILGSVQQVAGAAGIALFIAVMTIQNAALTAGGADQVTALAGGIRAGFLCGAIISLFAIVASIFVKKPPADPAMAGMGH